jgi:hypothetical protein
MMTLRLGEDAAEAAAANSSAARAQTESRLGISLVRIAGLDHSAEPA